jgi:hypothetical protein
MVVKVIIEHFVMVDVLVIVNEKMMYKNVSIDYIEPLERPTVVCTRPMVIAVPQLIHLSNGFGEQHSRKHVKVGIDSVVVLKIVL